MKTRVWKFGDYYYPQYKGWFFWHYIIQYGDRAVVFLSKEKAIDFLKSPWEKFEDVVWESGKEK